MKPVPLKQQAIRLLARREYSRAELESRLVGKGAVRADVQTVLDELTAVGLLSNERYARSIVNRNVGRASARSITSALKGKGVGGDDIAVAIAEAGIDDAATLVALWQRRFGTPPANDKDRARQVRFLQSRGFSLTAIFKLLRAEESERS